MASRIGLQRAFYGLSGRRPFWTYVLVVSFLTISLTSFAAEDFDLDAEDPEASTEEVIKDVKKKEGAASEKPTPDALNEAEFEPPPTPLKASAGKDLPEVKKAESLIRQKKYKEAADIFWKEIDKLGRREIVLLIRCHEIMKEWGEVARAANLILSRNPKDVDALTYIGMAAFHRGKPAEAKESLAKALEINPKQRMAYDIMADLYKDNPYERRLVYQDMIKNFGPKADLLAKLCELNTLDGDNDQADKTCLQAIQKDPKNPANHVYVGIIAKNRMETEKAKNLLRKAADQFPKSEFALVEYASLSESEKNYVDAFKYYEICLGLNPAAEKCLAGAGNAGVQIQKYERALETFREACKKYGRKHTANVRRAAHLLRSRNDSDWMSKFNYVADSCAIL